MQIEVCNVMAIFSFSIEHLKYSNPVLLFQYFTFWQSMISYPNNMAKSINFL